MITVSDVGRPVRSGYRYYRGTSSKTSASLGTGAAAPVQVERAGPGFVGIESETGEKGDSDNEWQSRNARSEAKSRADGRRNRSHRSRPWIFPPSSVARSLLVRGAFRLRPWPARSGSPCPRTHSGRRQREIAHRSTYVLVSAIFLDQAGRAVKPLALYEPVRTEAPRRIFLSPMKPLPYHAAPCHK